MEAENDQGDVPDDKKFLKIQQGMGAKKFKNAVVIFAPFFPL